MKKLMIAAATVCAAVAAQAASIMWGGDIALQDGVNAVGVGSTAYLIRGASAAGAAVTKITVDGTDLSKWTTDTGAAVVSSYVLTALDAESNYRFESLYEIGGAADAGYYSLVVVNGGAGVDGATGAYAFAGQNTLTDPTSGATVDLTIGDYWATGATFIGQSGYSAVSFAAAPEPTSGLLLLLGMAGLALRRKRA